MTDELHKNFKFYICQDPEQDLDLEKRPKSRFESEFSKKYWNPKLE
jgi:hypothetical protein